MNSRTIKLPLFLLLLLLVHGCQPRQYQPAHWDDVTDDVSKSGGTEAVQDQDVADLDLERFGELDPLTQREENRSSVSSDRERFNRGMTSLPARGGNQFSPTTLPNRLGTTLPTGRNGTTLPGRMSGMDRFGTTLPSRPGSHEPFRNGTTLPWRNDNPLRQGTTLPGRR